jgi:hypothetical protein
MQFAAKLAFLTLISGPVWPCRIDLAANAAQSGDMLWQQINALRARPAPH